MAKNYVGCFQADLTTNLGCRCMTQNGEASAAGRPTRQHKISLAKRAGSGYYLRAGVTQKELQAPNGTIAGKTNRSILCRPIRVRNVARHLHGSGFRQ